MKGCKAKRPGAWGSTGPESDMEPNYHTETSNNKSLLPRIVDMYAPKP